MSEELVKTLEDKLKELLTATSKLRTENHHLQLTEKKLMEEKSELLKKNNVAKAKVEAIISKLRTIEQQA